MGKKIKIGDTFYWQDSTNDWTYVKDVCTGIEEDYVDSFGVHCRRYFSESHPDAIITEYDIITNPEVIDMIEDVIKNGRKLESS